MPTRLLPDESHGGCAEANCFLPATWRVDGRKLCNGCANGRPDVLRALVSASDDGESQEFGVDASCLIGIYPGMEVRHVKSGRDYVVVCEAVIEATMTGAVVYRSVDGDKVWVRPMREFCDGRFVAR